MSEGPVAGNVADAAAGTGETQTDTTPQSSTDTSSGTPDSQGTGTNPAWNPLLETLPQSLHHLVIPHLKQWDKGVQDRFAEINGRYEPYKDFVENKVDPQVLAQALGLYQLMDTDPQKIFEAFIQQGFTVPDAQQATEQVVSGQGQESGEETGFEDPSFDVTQHPEFQRMQKIVETMAQSQLSTMEQEQTAQVEADLDEQFAQARALAEQHSIPWREASIARIMRDDENMTALQALEIYVEELRDIASSVQQPSAPVVLGGGGGVPSQQPDTRQMTGEQRRAYIQQRLKQAAEQSG